MRIELSIARCGFAMQVNEYDIHVDERVLFLLLLFWKAYYPARREWRVALNSRNHSCGRVSFTSAVNGKQTGWAIQGPIQRLG